MRPFPGRPSGALLIFLVALLLGIFTSTVKSEFLSVIYSNPNAYQYTGVTWPSSGEVFASGYHISGGSVLRSTDYGRTWTTSSSFEFGLYGIASLSLSNNGVVVLVIDESGQVLAYFGSSWTVVYSPLVPLVGVSIARNGNSFISGASGFVAKSSNASSYSGWTDVSPVSDASVFLYDISSYDGIKVITVGSDGIIYYSSNGGTSWTLATSSTTKTIYCISHVSSDFAMIAGESGYIAKTSNAGQTWTTLSAFPTTYTAKFHSISVLSTSVAYVAVGLASGADGGRIYETLNGGSTWRLVQSTTTTPLSLSLYSMTYGVMGSTATKPIYAIVPGRIVLFLNLLFQY
jgi:photosystem II stability/assembly factor-like uncharacterized protein